MKNRNQPCECGSGKKRKRCCPDAEAVEKQKQIVESNEYWRNLSKGLDRKPSLALASLMTMAGSVDG